MGRRKTRTDMMRHPVLLCLNPFIFELKLHLLKTSRLISPKLNLVKLYSNYTNGLSTISFSFNRNWLKSLS